MSDEIQTFEDNSELDKEFVVSDLETLKVLTDPVRLHILESLVQKPMTVKDLAKRLGSTPTKLYYHVNMMEEYGLIKVVSQRIVSGILEKRYRTRAKSFDVDKSLLALGGSQAGSPIDIMLQVVFDATREDVRRAIEMGLMKPTDTDPRERNGMLMRIVTSLTPDVVGEFHERVISLIKEFETRSEAQAPATGEEDQRVAYGFTVALFPVPADMPTSTTIID